MVKMKTKTNSNIENSNKKVMLILSAVLIVVLAISLPIYAWFSNRKGLVTMTKVQSPIALNIGAGNKESCAYIDMSGIDVEDKENTTKSKNFVFCVYSTVTQDNYNIQLAHTTNIPFTYKIYKASESATLLESYDVIYYDHTEEKNTHYYTTNKNTDEIQGHYLNKSDTSMIANDTQHQITYGEYDKNYVQDNAEPLYWQNNDSIEPSGKDSNTGFVDYYILEVSWEGQNTMRNNKETDMVYITAGAGT